jgi:DNA-binding transcriptional LysR family regulator
MPLVLEFLRHYPKVHVDIVTEGRLLDVVADGFDLGVRSANLVSSDMIVISFGQSQRYTVVGTSAYFDKHGRPCTPPDLLKYHCMRIRLPNGAISPWHFEREGEVIRLDVSGQLTLDEQSVVKAAVQEAMGLGFSWSRTLRMKSRPDSSSGYWKNGRLHGPPLSVLPKPPQSLRRAQGFYCPGPRQTDQQQAGHLIRRPSA